MTTDFHRIVAELAFDDLPNDLLHLLRRSLLDTIGVAAIGASTGMADIARQTALALFGPGTAGTARILMDGSRASPAGAAMAGAFTIDSIDAHDGTTPNKGHAGSAVFPAIFAVADSLRQAGHSFNGRDLAVWLALAYEVSYRAGQVQHSTCPDYHTSGSWTAVGVATAAARMLGASAEQIRHAAGIGEFHGPRSQMMRCIDHPTNLRDGVGWGAPSGVTAAYLARAGFTGAPALTCEGPDAAPYWQGFGQDWLTLAHTHYKLYPCCRWAHASMDSALGLMREHAISHEAVERVLIKTFHYATRLAGHAPQTLDELSYSIAFPVATVIVRGQMGPEELTLETLKDPDILRLSHATELIDDPELTARSVSQRWAQVTLILKNGSRLEAPERTPRGDIDAPLSDHEVLSKFHLLADTHLGKPCADRLAEYCLSFDRLDASGIAGLFDTCMRPINR